MIDHVIESIVGALILNVIFILIFTLMNWMVERSIRKQ